MMTPSASVPDRVMKRVRANGRGSVFTPRDVLDIASHAAVDQALSRLTKAGHVRRRVRGLYDFPNCIPNSGPCPPRWTTYLAQALARETGSHLQIDGARAANALGLSTQVAAQSTWLTDGPSRRVVLGKRIVDLRHASPKHLIAPGSPAGTIVQALRHVGAYRAADVLQVAARTLSDGDERLLCKSAAQTPAWMRATLLSIAGLGNEDGLK